MESKESPPAPLYVDQIAALALGGAALVGMVAVWPAFTLLAAAMAIVAYLAWHNPPVAFVLAVALFGIEGTAKVALTHGATPFGLSPETVAAAMLDLGLVVAGAGLLRHVGRDAVRSIWSGLGRAGRAGAILLAAWLVISAAQIFQGGDAARGLEGFRLTQFYVFAAAAGALLTRAGAGSRTLSAGVWLLLPISAYAALRTLIGPAAIERTYAVSRGGVTEFQFGDVFRTVGSFSGAVGLASFLVPAAVFALTVAVFGRRSRTLGAIVFALALIGLAGSQVRVGVVAVVVGLGVAVLMALGGRVLSPGRRLVPLAAVLSALVVVGAAAAVAGSASAETRERARAYLRPFSDDSVQERLDTWEAALDDAAGDPLGSGLGTVGASTRASGETPVTTDNSYLKVLREQGFGGALLFMLGVLALVVAAGIGLKRASRDQAAVGVAALAGFVGFLVLAGAGEYIEQPGKVLAWTLLGVAVGMAARVPSAEPSLPSPESWRDRLAGLISVPWVVVGLVLVILPLAIGFARDSQATATVRLYPAYADTEYETGHLGVYAHSLLVSSDLRSNIVEASGLLVNPRAIEEQVSVERDGGHVLLRARAETGDRARTLADAAAILVAGASGERLVLGARAEGGRATRRMDRVARALPGETPPRVDPLFAVLSGLVLTTVIALGVGTRRQQA